MIQAHELVTDSGEKIKYYIRFITGGRHQDLRRFGIKSMNGIQLMPVIAVGFGKMEDGKFLQAMAVCSSLDMANRKRARKIVEGRLLKAASEPIGLTQQGNLHPKRQLMVLESQRDIMIKLLTPGTLMEADEECSDETMLMQKFLGRNEETGEPSWSHEEVKVMRLCGVHFVSWTSDQDKIPQFVKDFFVKQEG